ncbi:TIGR02996 domain-containing protein [Singulisphaera sp. PoT]|uniref:TIGR02996 domain-containing protein n=1 Tax=Singulisphaera sp. PoT TaxID=3411797 RepID=UPI003BF49B14
MQKESEFLNSIKFSQDKDLLRLSYAEWLDARDDIRGHFIRLQLALGACSPDHIDRVAGEHELSQLRRACSPDWLAIIEPENLPRHEDELIYCNCQCFDMGGHPQKKRSPLPCFHTDAQDTECDAWKRLLDLIEEAAADGREEFDPFLGMSLQERSKIVTLPASIAKLKAVKTLVIYGSWLVRIPPEIREMTSLVDFDPYSSYRLHWFPYELSQCPNLRESRVSTRALYGNFKYRPPFPWLKSGVPIVPGRSEPSRLPLKFLTSSAIRTCSVCSRPFEDQRHHRVWISSRVATDVLPLLVNACSSNCIKLLPTPPEGYVQEPHKGGAGVAQPPRY